MREAPIKTFFLAGTFFIAASAPAFALDSADFISKVKNAYETYSGITFTHGDVEKSGKNGLVIKGVVFAPAEDMSPELDDFQQKEPLTINLSGIKENDDGSYVVGKLSLEKAAFAAEDMVWTIGTFKESNLHVPATPDVNNPSGWLYGEESHLEDVTLEYEGKTVMTIPSAEGTQTFDAETQTAGFTASTGDITLDLTNVDDLDDDFRNGLETLELLKSTSTFDLAGTWNIVTGDFDMSSYDFSVKDAGTLKISLGVTGFTLETLETLRDMQDMPEDMASEDDTTGDDGMDPYQAQMMELGQQIGVSGLSIRFEDASITNRLLKMLADEEGVTAEAFAEGIKTDINSGLTALNVPDLADMVTTAVDTYLKDPQNFTVSIAPQMQMPILAVIMAGAAAPQSVPQLLNLEVKAND